MYKYFVLSIFLSTFYFLIKKDRVYVVPFIFIIYSNINGLLDWEDFAVHGMIKFQDYGLVITLIMLMLIHPKKIGQGRLNVQGKKFAGQVDQSSNNLYGAIWVFSAYYFFEFIYSVMLQGGIDWPIKMGRGFFYGLVFFVVVRQLRPNPIVLYNKVINVLKAATIVFGLIYVGYNLFGIDFYPNEAIENFALEGFTGVKRNFAGFPYFTFYFLILFAHQLVSEDKLKKFNFFGLILMSTCVFLTLTRGAVIAMFVVLVATLFFRLPSTAVVRKVIVIVGGLMFAAPIILYFAQGYLEVLTLRFSEFTGGAEQAGNYIVRAIEFERILNNVIDFNPLFGFGFTNLSELGLGYQSSLIHAGSADNGYANLIGVSGFVGLSVFLMVMISWLIVNIKLQLLNRENFAKVHFIFILYIFISMLNGSSMSYTESFALFMAYDLLAYNHLLRIKNSEQVRVQLKYSVRKTLERLKS